MQSKRYRRQYTSLERWILQSRISITEVAYYSHSPRTLCSHIGMQLGTTAIWHTYQKVIPTKCWKSDSSATTNKIYLSRSPVRDKRTYKQPYNHTNKQIEKNKKHIWPNRKNLWPTRNRNVHIQVNSKNAEQCLSRRNTLTINLVDTPPDKEHVRLTAEMLIIGDTKYRQSDM